MSQDKQNPNQPGQGDAPRPHRPMFDQDAPAPAAPRQEAPPPRRTPPPEGVRRSGEAPPPPQRPVVNQKRTVEARRKKRRRRRIIGITALVLVVALVVGIFAVYQHIAGQLSGTNTVDGSLPDDVRAADLPEYTGKGIICGLVCGLDYDNETADGYEDPDNKIGNTDLILYVMFDTVNGSANILQIPRDIYVGDELATGGNYKINSLYRFSEDPDNRIAPLARAINDQLKLPIDFYITIDMDAVKAIVDHMGTLEVYVPRDVVDPENPGNVLEEGWRHFTGEEAEFFLRNRNYVDGDVTRLAMQQSFYSALFREFKRLTPTDLLIWMRIVLYYVNVEGISLVEIGGLGQKALGLTSEDITFVRPPVIGTKYKGKALVYLDADETAELLNQYFRPDGHGYTAEELNIFTLDTDLYGKSEAQIISMASIQGQEAPHQ